MGSSESFTARPGRIRAGSMHSSLRSPARETKHLLNYRCGFLGPVASTWSQLPVRRPRVLPPSRCQESELEPGWATLEASRDSWTRLVVPVLWSRLETCEETVFSLITRVRAISR